MRYALVVSIIALLCGLESACGEDVLPVTKLVRLPVYKMTAFVDATARERFLQNLRAFADKQGFAITIDPTTPDGAHVIAELSREDVRVVALNPFDDLDPTEFRIRIYTSDQVTLPDSARNELVEALTAALCNLSGVRCLPSVAAEEKQLGRE